MAYVKNGPINNTIVMRYIFTGDSKAEVVWCVLINELNKKIKLQSFAMKASNYIKYDDANF